MKPHEFNKECNMVLPPRRKKSAIVARWLLTTSLVAAPVSAWAQNEAAAQVPAMAAAPSESAMVNLVRLLIAQKVINKAQGEALMAQALEIGRAHV